MADDFAPDEWDPPQLNRHLPFPPPIGFDLGVRDTAPLLIGALLAAELKIQDHALPSWYIPACVAIAVVWTVNFLIKPQGRRLFAWIPVLYRYFRLWLHAPWLMRPIPYRWAKKVYPGGKLGFWSFVLARDQGRQRLANVVVEEDGVIDTTASFRANRVVHFCLWLLAIVRGKEPLVRLIWVSDTGSLDLLDPEAREGVWVSRMELLARPDHRMSLYLRVRPFPASEIFKAAGVLGAKAEAGDREATSGSCLK